MESQPVASFKVHEYLRPKVLDGITVVMCTDSPSGILDSHRAMHPQTRQGSPMSVHGYLHPSERTL